MHEVVPDLARFYLPWLAAAAVAAEESAPSHALTVQFDGLSLPVLQLALALAGVLMARPLAPKRVPPLGWAKSLLVTVIMVLVAASWVIEARPGLLFAFVISIGLGFSGYALIELIGGQVQTFVKSVFEGAIGTLGKLTGKRDQ
ncbi:MAG: hypothetical protein ABL914_10885 [Novosphingobium sp.]|uniref:hypothetical protein n=1 Tax=Novosphingobium sp. TaxID=1874826 RepID=UPI0032BB0C80